MRWLHALPILPALLTASCATGDPGARAPRQGTLSVVSFNLYHDKADWPRRLPLIVSG